MTRIKWIVTSVLAILAVGTIIYPVLAHCGKCAADAKTIAAQLDQNKMTLAKAVAAAESHSKGRAISVLSQLNEHKQVATHVWCVAGEADAPKIFKCQIDLATGKVANMKEVHEFPIAQDKPHVDPAPGSSTHATSLTNQTVSAGCGVCIYKMPGITGCPLAIKVDEKMYLVEGAQWPNHDYCDRHDCKAIVTGKIEGNPPKFIATSFEPVPR